MKKIGTILGAGLLLALAIFAWWLFSRPERGTTGSIGTKYHRIGSNDNYVASIPPQPGEADPKNLRGRSALLSQLPAQNEGCGRSET